MALAVKFRDFQRPAYFDRTQLEFLWAERQRIEMAIRALVGLGNVERLDRPLWGPCTRCGYLWLGHDNGRVPKNCARCHSVGWCKEPHNVGGRRPHHPRNEKWFQRAKQTSELIGQVAGVVPMKMTPPPDPTPIAPSTYPDREMVNVTNIPTGYDEDPANDDPVPADAAAVDLGPEPVPPSPPELTLEDAQALAAMHDCLDSGGEDFHLGGGYKLTDHDPACRYCAEQKEASGDADATTEV